jgi:hypothetical protein
VVEAFASERLERTILQGPTREGLNKAETALLRFLEEEVEETGRKPK